jgi:hypothetical protein
MCFPPQAVLDSLRRKEGIANIQGSAEWIVSSLIVKGLVIAMIMGTFAMAVAEAQYQPQVERERERESANKYVYLQYMYIYFPR